MAKISLFLGVGSLAIAMAGFPWVAAGLIFASGVYQGHRRWIQRQRYEKLLRQFCDLYAELVAPLKPERQQKKFTKFVKEKLEPKPLEERDAMLASYIRILQETTFWEDPRVRVASTCLVLTEGRPMASSLCLLTERMSSKDRERRTARYQRQLDSRLDALAIAQTKPELQDTVKSVKKGLTHA